MIKKLCENQHKWFIKENRKGWDFWRLYVFYYFMHSQCVNGTCFSWRLLNISRGVDAPDKQHKKRLGRQTKSYILKSYLTHIFCSSLRYHFAVTTQWLLFSMKRSLLLSLVPPHFGEESRMTMALQDSDDKSITNFLIYALNVSM